MAKIEINGIPIEAQDGAMVIEVADEAGIVIPRFCYHSKLSIAANCRMCLVEVEKVGKPLPACATPVTDGMKVFTRSPKAIAAQRSVMEFLLINHPLDCPICDQGGECDLQEMAMGFGQDVSRFSEGKRVAPDPDLGPLIATDMTRCIHCTRCVRFGQEIAGVTELGATGRGEHTRIGTYVEKAVGSEVSGNIIDLCPVGALTSRPYRYTARPWELIAHDSISPHDCVGANLRVDVRGRRVMRVLPRENEAVNETWIADRDRFSYLGLSARDRLTAPLVKRDGVWQETDWDNALTYAAEGLKRVVENGGPGRLGALAGYSNTVEEYYLLQRVLRGLGSDNIDHRLRQLDFRGQAQAPAFPWLGQSLQDLESVDAALLIGSNVRKEQPLVGLRLRKAALAGAHVMSINPMDYPFNFPIKERVVTTPVGMVRALGGIAQALSEATGESLPANFAKALGDCEPGETHRAMAEVLKAAERPAVLLGSGAAHHAQQAPLRALSQWIAERTGARLGSLAEGGNSAGAWLAGAVPHRRAGGQASAANTIHWRGMAEAGLEGYLLLGTEPELDSLDPAALTQALNEAGFVVSLTAFATDAMRRYADVLLPIALFPETSGTFVNTEGRWQSFAGCVAPPEEARPAWKILRVLGNLFDLAGFEYLSSEDVRDELRAVCSDMHPQSGSVWDERWDLALEPALARIADFPIYTVDPLVRRSSALQQTPDGAVTARLNPSTAERLGVSGESIVVRQGEGHGALRLKVDSAVPDNCVYVPGGCPETEELGAAHADVRVEAALGNAPEANMVDRKRG